MHLTNRSMRAEPGRGRRRRRIGFALSLGLGSLSGCATQATWPHAAGTHATTALPGNLFDVASLVPILNPASVQPEAPEPRLEGGTLDREARAASSLAPADTLGAVASSPPAIPQASPARPVDLATALRLADGQNPVIGEARVLILEALAQRTAARALLVPTLNAGFNYRDHNGPLQRSTGLILPVNLQSLYYGGGARTVAAESIMIPAVNIFSPLTDALFEPLAAEQRVVGTRFNASATMNTTLLDVAGLYIDLVGFETILATRRELAAEADRVATEVAAYAATGQGRKSDADRAEGDRRLVQAQIQKAEEDVAVASARLAERLNLDPANQLQPLSGPMEPIALIEAETPVEELIRSAVFRRPDLAARDALAMQAQYRVREEKARPFLPTIWMGFSGGTSGGGSNILPPALGRYDGRTDFDIRAYWTLLNFGVGNTARIKQRQAQFLQAQAERARVLNQIRDEVTTARASSLAAQRRVEVARAAVRTSEEGYREDQSRLRETLGRPIEALDSLRLLVDSRITLIRAIVDANRAQFALFVSLGAPPPLVEVPRSGLAPGP